MLVKIDNDTALEMLLDRLELWTRDFVARELYGKMYDNYIISGCFDGGEFDPMVIVDNDWINYCTIVEDGDAEYAGIKELYDRDGLGDISCEHDLNGGYSLIEAEYEGAFLVRA